MKWLLPNGVRILHRGSRNYPAVRHQYLAWIGPVERWSFPGWQKMVALLACLSLAALASGCLMMADEAGASKSRQELRNEVRKAEDAVRAAKRMVTLRFHLEESAHAPGASVLRSDHIKISVQKTAFLDQGDVTKASVVDGMPGGFMLRIELTHRGKADLQIAKEQHPGRRVAVWCRWNKRHWLAAPVLEESFKNGDLLFKLDCTQVEADQIVIALNKLAFYLGNQPMPTGN